MNLTAVRNLVTSKAALQVLKVRKHAPIILFVAGTVGVVTTVVLASRATLKLSDTLEDGDRERAKIQMINVPNYTEEDRKKDLAKNYARTAFGVAKLYAPTVIVGTASIMLLTGAHVILTRRNVALTAAYAGLEQAYQQYRKRVVDELGPEKDAQFRYGLTMENSIGEDGLEHTKYTVSETEEPSQYARFFDESNPNWESAAWRNQQFIQCQETYANQRLNAYGFLFLNDVYEMLGFPKTPAGQIVGWLKGVNGADGYVDFGLFRDKNNTKHIDFVNGNEPSVLLDFNVDGLIWKKI